MYRLLPGKKSITAVLTLVVALAVYADEFETITGIDLSDQILVRYLPLIIVLILTVVFAPCGRWALWRYIWKIFPPLNNFFPDINGVWRGNTNSNWPIVKKIYDTAQSDCALQPDELNSISLQTDALAIEIKATLFKVQITSSLTSTKSKSHSIIVCPRKDNHNCLHLSYVYNQDTPNPSSTDVDNHLGAANLVIELENLKYAEGVYWTRRNWKAGLNTAGLLKLQRVEMWKDRNKSLYDYATDSKNELESRE